MKKNNKKGFTLAELLIVVAIIAVLTAVAIPIFATQLEKSREETDIANMRAAKAAGVALILDDGLAEGASMKFDAAKGVLVDASTTVTGYGKGTGKDGGATAFENYSNTTPYTNQVITVTNTNGVPVLSWN